MDRACLHSTRWPSWGFNTFFGIFFATKGGDLKIQDFKMEDSRRITTLLASAIPFGRARWPQRAAGLTLAHHPAKRRVEANAPYHAILQLPQPGHRSSFIAHRRSAAPHLQLELSTRTAASGGPYRSVFILFHPCSSVLKSSRTVTSQISMVGSF